MDNKDSGKNVATQVVNMLVDAGVKNVYGITGDSLNAFTEAVAADERINFIHMRHEESGAFAASAEAQLTGGLACCAGSSGPGHVHLVNGLYDAKASDAPVVAFASTCPTNVFGTEYFQETDPSLLFADCSVYNQLAETPAQVPVMLQQAMQQALSKGGVGVVGLPADVVGAPAAEPGASTDVYATKDNPSASEDEIKRCADMINSASTVAIFAGMGSAQATDELARLADILKAPVATSFKSQLAITVNCPNYVGHMGYLGMWSAEDAIDNADVILILGTNYPFPGMFPDDKKIIQVDIRAGRIGKRAKVNIGIRADVKGFINALIPQLSPKTDSTFLNKALADWGEIKEKMQEPVKARGKMGRIRPEYFYDLLNRKADDDAIFTVDTGMNCVWASHYLEAAKGRKMIGSFMHGSMANAMPQAIGCHQACPDKQVIALCGDGGLEMLMGDLLTIIQYNMPVKIFVADNSSLAYVQWEMELAGLKPTEVALKNPDLGEIAKTMGFQAETVTDPDKLEAAVDRWLSAKGPAFLSVTTDTTAASFTFSKKMMKGATPENMTSNFS